jgi:murein DD-endopeptidase MepM/ murein hydrolase activator NlpD
VIVSALFPERQLVLRTGLRRRCFTISTTVQAAVVLAAAGVTLWQSVVTSEWLISAATIARKNYQIVDLRVDRDTAIDSKKSSDSRFRGLGGRISAEIESIQKNLALLARHDGLTSQPLAAYASAASDPTSQHGRLPLDPRLEEKLAQLEDSLRVLKAGHTALLMTSNETASEQLDRLEGALKKVGVDTGKLVVSGRGGPKSEPCNTEGVSCGGPFVPAAQANAAGDTSPDALYATLQRWDDVVAATSQLPLGMPVENMYLSSGFGRRRDPLNGRVAVHAGLDYAGLAYTPVLATGGGVVSFSNRRGRYGNMVEIDHGHGFYTRYGHLAEISVTVGQKVERGTEIGLVGSTGRSTGPHLHYELRVGNEARDPLKFIGVGKNVFERNSRGSKG